MADDVKVDLDDFPLSPRGSVAGEAYYQAFLQGEELLKSLPKKIQSSSDESSLYAFVKELVVAKAGAPALFRRRTDADEALSRFWLSRVRATAQWTVLLNAVAPFAGLSAEDLPAIARKSTDVGLLPKLADEFAERGIVLLYEPALPGMKLDGAVFTLESGHPVICLSLRYARLDIFWFTVLHELAHVVLHHDQLSAPITDDFDTESEGLVELQADRLARDSMISRSDWRNCSAKYTQSEAEVIQFAQKIGIHPAIVAGRLRREWNKHTIFTDIVNSVNVRKVLLGHE